ncbi:MAG: NifU family protein [Bernardetiaceae bacterium]|jgi:Fe-S cluster biogenesis protein NfuA|nr:NifU family protein [Bernardetiaceae bacterium]
MEVKYNADQLYKKLITVYTEAVPNPEAMKFVVNTMLAPDDDFLRDYAEAGQTTDSPLAQELFKYDFVRRVFITKNFVTVTKDPAADWSEKVPVVRHFLKNYLEEGHEVFSGLADDPVAPGQDNDSETVRKIKEILDEYIRPAVEMDGGNISLNAYDEATGTVKVFLQGSCSGCPSSTITLKAGIENLLRRMMPDQVKTVVAEGV